MKESFFKVRGAIVNNKTGYEEEFNMFTRAVDNRYAVMIVKEYLRTHAPNTNGRLMGEIIVHEVTEKKAEPEN
ncbi:MAG: hypothetical protein COV67_11865 [Nitrospinae bacterium CG11_big_fil_rev_8_21_14_0_20_56_8]|nr:MAG: hypothetical protein COV67_11865 [Nitrospinae bacterium CG11_big_fil_rev_8_21_14_0_20_56_8]